MIVILSEAKDLTRLQSASYPQPIQNKPNSSTVILKTCARIAGSLAALGMTEREGLHE
jgi:hypothetical protein